MDVEVKDLITWGAGLAGIVGSWFNLKGSVKSNTKDIDAMKALLTSGRHGGAPFITVPEHEKMQSDCQAALHTKIDAQNLYLQNVDRALREFADAQHKRDDKVLEAVSELKGIINERIKQSAA